MSVNSMAQSKLLCLYYTQCHRFEWFGSHWQFDFFFPSETSHMKLQCLILWSRADVTSTPFKQSPFQRYTHKGNCKEKPLLDLLNTFGLQSRE